MPMRRFLRTFTLIELLVVIAVIAILAAILFPVFARAREQARKVSCVSNLRQLGMGMGMYLQDWDESFPNTDDPFLYAGRRFRFPIMPYLALGQKKASAAYVASSKSALLRCPSDPKARGFDDTSYAYSAAFFHSPEQLVGKTAADMLTVFPCATQTLASVASPARKVLLFEWNNSHEFSGASQPVGPWGTLTASRAPGQDRWSGGRVCAFVDGHVAFVFSRKLAPSVDDCPDPSRTPGGTGGSDLTE